MLKNKILYHGSDRDFEKFEIKKEYAKHDIQAVLPEGLGIYMTEKFEISKSYGGGKVYIVEIDKKNILDFTTFKSTKKIITNFLKINDTENLLFDLDNTIDCIINDRVSIIKLIRELVLYNEEYIYNVIDDNFDFYDYEDQLSKSWSNYINKYCLAYNSNDLGIVYIAKNTDILNIIGVD